MRRVWASGWMCVYSVFGAGIENQGKTAENSTIFGVHAFIAFHPNSCSNKDRVLNMHKGASEEGDEDWVCRMCKRSERGREKYQTKR